jgi:hypothetical protein
MSLRSTLDFLLYDWLARRALDQRALCRPFARDLRRGARHLRAHRAREVRAVQPPGRHRGAALRRREGDPAAGHARRAQAYVESGMVSAAQDYDEGGMQLPYTIEAAAGTFFALASVSIGSSLLTKGNANLLLVHGTEAQKAVFARNEFGGRFTGTMCLSEPQAGSSLSDVATRALRMAATSRAIRSARATASRATRCGSRPANTSWPRTSSTSCWPRSRAGRQAGAGHARHLAVHRAQEAGGHRRPAHRRAQRRRVGRPEPQAGLARHHQHAAEFRRRQVPGARRRRRHRLPGGQARRGPALHVPHDERGAHRHRPGGHGAGPGGLLRVARLREEPPAGPPVGPGRQGRRAAAGAHHRARRHQAHAAGAEVVRRRRPGAAAVLRPPGRRAAHRHAGSRRGGAPAAGSADAGRQELAQRVLPGSELAGHPGSRRLRLHARLSRWSSTGATTA